MFSPIISSTYHNHLFQLHGYCIPRDPSSSSTIDRLATVTEIGEPLLVVRLVQIDWIDRLRLIESIANFVNRLRPRLLLDLRRQQFVTVDDRELRPICVDFDDIAIIGYETNNDYCSRIGLCIGKCKSYQLNYTNVFIVIFRSKSRTA